MAIISPLMFIDGQNADTKSMRGKLGPPFHFLSTGDCKHYHRRFLFTAFTHYSVSFGIYSRPSLLTDAGGFLNYGKLENASQRHGRTEKRVFIQRRIRIVAFDLALTAFSTGNFPFLIA